MTKDEMLKHEQVVLKDGKAPEDVYDQSTVALVEMRVKMEREFRTQR
jgi:hypothetical protein